MELSRFFENTLFYLSQERWDWILIRSLVPEGSRSWNHSLLCDADIGGAGPPWEVMTDVMSYISDATPVWYVFQTLQGLWFGIGLDMVASLIVTGIALLATVLSARFFRWE